MADCCFRRGGEDNIGSLLHESVLAWNSFVWLTRDFSSSILSSMNSDVSLDDTGTGGRTKSGRVGASENAGARCCCRRSSSTDTFLTLHAAQRVALSSLKSVQWRQAQTSSGGNKSVAVMAVTVDSMNSSWRKYRERESEERFGRLDGSIRWLRSVAGESRKGHCLMSRFVRVGARLFVILIKLENEREVLARLR